MLVDVKANLMANINLPFDSSESHRPTGHFDVNFDRRNRQASVRASDATTGAEGDDSSVGRQLRKCYKMNMDKKL